MMSCDDVCTGSTRLSQALTPPARSHDHPQGQHSDDEYEEDEGQEEEERTTHLGKHRDSPPSIPLIVFDYTVLTA